MCDGGGAKLDLKNPQRFNEKLQWLKLYDRNPLYTALVDKYAVKQWVEKRCGKEIIIPTLFVWDRVEDIEWDKLPNQFVLKTTHSGDSLGVVICKDKTCFDKQKAIKELSKSISKDYYKTGREWPYKNVKHRIIAEEYMEDSKYHELRDYKFFCFDGVVKALFIASGRQSDALTFDYFDENFKNLHIKQSHPNSEELFVKPASFELMKDIASKLSSGLPHVRVDLYDVNGKVYFGEMTFYHYGGFVGFHPDKWDYMFGSWINLPIK